MKEIAEEEKITVMSSLHMLQRIRRESGWRCGESRYSFRPALFLQLLGDDVNVFLLFEYFLYLLVRLSTDYNYGHERFSL
jgi:hypothetical protein